MFLPQKTMNNFRILELTAGLFIVQQGQEKNKYKKTNVIRRIRSLYSDEMAKPAFKNVKGEVLER
jgi:hypothetical protein